jgi:transcriptional regulator with XRE-family HTH domain
LTEQRSSVLVFTDLGIADELKDKEFRNQFFRTEREIDIPAQIKAIRKFRDMTQKELAELVGTKQSAISRIEQSQESNWELETLVKLAEALDARLAVVIEPYESVTARLKSLGQFSKQSAATSDIGSAPPEQRKLGNGHGQIPPQNEEKRGASQWS